MRATTALIALASCTLLAGCGRGGGVESVEPAPGQVIRLLEAGREPRAPLRHRLAAGTRSFDVEQSTTEGEGPDGQTRTTRAVLEATVSDVKEADARLDVTLRIVASDGSASPSSPVVAGGLTVSVAARVSGRGQVVGATSSLSGAEAGPGQDGRREALASVVFEQVRQAMPPLPQEPVGVGARWSVEGASSALGLAVPVRTEYTLEALEGGAALVRSRTVGQVRDRAVPAEGGTVRVGTLDLALDATAKFTKDLVFGESEVRSTTRLVGTMAAARTATGGATPAADPDRRVTANSTSTLSIRSRK